MEPPVEELSVEESPTRQSKFPKVLWYIAAAVGLVMAVAALAVMIFELISYDQTSGLYEWEFNGVSGPAVIAAEARARKMCGNDWNCARSAYDSRVALVQIELLWQQVIAIAGNRTLQ